MAVAAVVADAASCTASGTRVAGFAPVNPTYVPGTDLYGQGPASGHVGQVNPGLGGGYYPASGVDANVGPRQSWPSDAYYGAQSMPYYPPPPQDDFFDPGYTTVYQLPGYWG